MIRDLQETTKSLCSGQTPGWFNDLRLESLSQFNKLGIPTVKDEEWKYTNLLPLSKTTFDLISEEESDNLDILKEYCSDHEVNIVLINGSLSPERSNFNNVKSGITISTIADAVSSNAPGIQELLTKYNLNDTPAFAALNQAANPCGTFIRINPQIVFEPLIHIVHVTSSRRPNIASMPRTLIAIGKSSEVTILESHITLNDNTVYFANALTDIFLEENATLHYCKSQKESFKAFHIGSTRVWQERNSNFDGFSFMAGSILARNNLDVVLNGEGAATRLNALYSVYNEQHVDNHTFIDHRVPNCTSNQLYKGVLNNAAHAVFNGKVYVHPIAQKTNSYQLNKNLLLGSRCLIDTKPQLEIFADDVKCTHGATVGQLDEEEMFYLQTRCIPKKTALMMLARGFVDDLFNTIKNQNIRTKLNRLMEPSFKALQ